MTNDRKWALVLERTSELIGKEIPASLDGVLLLIGLQKLGKPFQKFSRDQKMDLLHIGLCEILSREGYYRFEKKDEDGWPHYRQIKEWPARSAEEGAEAIKNSVISYFEDTMGWEF